MFLIILTLCLVRSSALTDMYQLNSKIIWHHMQQRAVGNGNVRLSPLVVVVVGGWWGRRRRIALFMIK
jgi:hypothetical protein